MKQLLSFVIKEFHHVFRDRKTLLMLFGLPIAQIILFGFALTNEIKNAKIIVVDYAKDAASRQIIDKIEASKYFDVENSLSSHEEIEAAFKEGKIKMAIVFPLNFYEDLSRTNKAQLQVIADASDINTATTLTNYISSIVMDYQNSLTRGIKPFSNPDRSTYALQSTIERRTYIHPRYDGDDYVADLCYDDSHFHRS